MAKKKKTEEEVSLEEIVQLYREAKEEVSTLESERDELQDRVDRLKDKIYKNKIAVEEASEIKKFFEELGIPDRMSLADQIAIKEAVCKALEWVI